MPVVNASEVTRAPLVVDASEVRAGGTSAEGGDQSTREQLKNEGFLDSAWNALKSGPAAIASLLTGEHTRVYAAERDQMKKLEESGTPEQRREYAKDYLLRHIPFASTAYKATQGNIPGALGDIVGSAPYMLLPSPRSNASTGETMPPEAVPVPRTGATVPGWLDKAGTEVAIRLASQAAPPGTRWAARPLIRAGVNLVKKAYNEPAVESLQGARIMTPEEMAANTRTAPVPTAPPVQPQGMPMQGTAEYIAPPPASSVPVFDPNVPLATGTTAGSIPPGTPTAQMVNQPTRMYSGPLNPPAPIPTAAVSALEEIAQRHFQQPYADLPPEYQVFVRNRAIADATPPPPPTPRPVYQPEPAAPSRTVQDLLAEDLAAKRAAAAPPEPPPAPQAEPVSTPSAPPPAKALTTAQAEAAMARMNPRTEQPVSRTWPDGSPKSQDAINTEILNANTQAKAVRVAQFLSEKGAKAADVAQLAKDDGFWREVGAAAGEDTPNLSRELIVKEMQKLERATAKGETPWPSDPTPKPDETIGAHLTPAQRAASEALLKEMRGEGEAPVTPKPGEPTPKPKRPKKAKAAGE